MNFPVRLSFRGCGFAWPRLLSLQGLAVALQVLLEHTRKDHQEVFS